MDNLENVTEKMHKSNPFVSETVGTVLKELPNGESNGCWVWATREIQDSSGDIILVDGLDFTTFHNPPETCMKVLPQHFDELPNAEPVAVGKVTQFKVMESNYRGKVCKGLAVYFEWLRDEQGVLLPMAKKYYDAVKAGGIDQVSVGLMPKQVVKNPQGRYLVKSATLFELSLVTLADNQGATIITKQKEDNMDGMEDIRCQLKELKACVDDMHKKVGEMHCAVCENDKVSKSLSEIPTAITSYMDRAVVPVLTEMRKRIDVLESATVLASEGNESLKPKPKNDSAVNEELKKLSESLNKTVRFLD